MSGHVNKAAQTLGRLGGKATSEAKRRAARENWKKATVALKRKRKAANGEAERQLKGASNENM